MSKKKKRRKQKTTKNKSNNAIYLGLENPSVEIDEKFLKNLKKVNSEHNKKYGTFTIVWAIGIILLTSFILFKGVSISISSMDEITEFSDAELERKISQFSIISILSYLTCIIIFCITAIRLLFFPKGKKTEKFWINRRKYRLVLLSSLLAMLALFIALMTPNGFYESESKRIETAAGAFFVVISSGILLSILNNPKLVFNKKITSLGTVSIWLIVLLFLKKVLVNIFNFSNPILLFISLISIVIILEFLKKKNSLNFIEYGAARFTEPKNLLFAIGGKENEIKNEKRVLVEIEKRMKMNDWGYLNKLNQKLIEKFVRKESIWMRIFNVLIIGVGYKIIDSLGEGIFQDLWLDDLKKLLCRYLEVLC